MKRCIVIFLLGGAAGWLAGGRWLPEDGIQAPVTVVNRLPREVSAERTRTRNSRQGIEEILAGMRQRAAMMEAPGYSHLGKLLEEWSNEEIIAALRESISDPAAYGLPGEPGNATLGLLTEWMKRDFDTSTRWFSDLDSVILKGLLAQTIASNWPQDRSRDGLAFYLENRSVMGFFGNGADMVSKMLASAAAEGPQAVNDMLRAVRENNMQFYSLPQSFPPGFDFGGLAAGGELRAITAKDFENPVIMAWAKADADAAYQWTLENLGAGHVRSQLLGRMAGGEPDDMNWSAAQYERMTAEQRDEFRKSAGNFLGRDLLNVPAFSNAIQDPELRDEIRLQGVQGIFSGRIEIAEAMLEQLGPPERRLEILENLEHQSRLQDKRYPDSTINEDRLREILGGWTDDGNRIDSIIDRLKQ